MNDSDPVVRWLLEEEQPAVRYLTLTELLDTPENDPSVRAAKAMITRRGWAAEILSKQDPGGWWVRGDSFYWPKYLSGNWMLLILSDLGLDRSEPRVAKGCELWIERYSKPDGGFSMEGAKAGHVCLAGNTARALVKFGYEDHPKVARDFDWMVKNSSHLGGWSCFGSGRNLDSWEPLSAFAVYPRQKWTKGMKEVVEKGAEFFLQRELHVQGDHYEPWYRFHYPVHYYYDLLVGLDVMTALGYGGDKRLAHAVSVLKKKRRRDGRWVLDAVHPDLEGAAAEWNRAHPRRAPTPFSLERQGEPSKMVTLRALRVLKRLDEAGATG